MLYLAEVQKKGMLGGKTELKLLACQRSADSWTTLPNEEIIPAEEANNLNSGVLVLVDLTANKQVQKVEEAARKLVGVLQNFSREKEKTKSNEEEIEQWKQSLTYQSQELNRREMEMEARREQLEQLEADFEQLQHEREEFKGIQDEALRLKEEVERGRQELESAWDHLRGEMNRLEDRQAELQGKSSLDQEQSGRIQELLNQLLNVASPTETIREQLNVGFEVVNGYQTLLDGYWQNLDQVSGEAQRNQEQFDQRSRGIHDRWQEWHTAQAALEEVKGNLRAKQALLEAKQSYSQRLSLQQQSNENLYQQVYQLADVSDQVLVGEKVDFDALEKMTLGELQSVVQELQREFEKTDRMVKMQEEELADKQQAIDDLRVQIQQASEYDRLRLETDMADEQESYQMLNESLEGPRRTLRERQEILKQHQNVLLRRQGQSAGSQEERQIDLRPVLLQLDSQRKQSAEQLQQLEADIQQLSVDVQQAQDGVSQQTEALESRRNEIKQAEQELSNYLKATAELWGRAKLYQEILQPVQDNLNRLRERLEAIGNALAQFQEARDQQTNSLNHLNQVFQGLMN